MLDIRISHGKGDTCCPILDAWEGWMEGGMQGSLDW